jgi:hypothetical protein
VSIGAGGGSYSGGSNATDQTLSAANGVKNINIPGAPVAFNFPGGGGGLAVSVAIIAAAVIYARR